MPFYFLRHKLIQNRQADEQTNRRLNGQDRNAAYYIWTAAQRTILSGKSQTFNRKT